MVLGEKIRALRIKHGLTQEELADRCELSKGFISQLERDLTSPSINTLMDILECLGTNIGDFFVAENFEKFVFDKNDFFIKDNGSSIITWLVPNAQKNIMEPILFELQENSSTEFDDPHDGEEFGYVLTGSICVEIGKTSKKCSKGESFSFKPSLPHRIINKGKSCAKIIWISTPPSF